MADSFPLTWPLGYPRSKRRKSSRFQTPMGKARDGLLVELRMMSARNVVISTNIQTYRRGGVDIPYANQSRVIDPGVAVYFAWKGDQYVLACDQWNAVADNIQAIRKTIEAMRGIDRWGVSEILKRSFSGFKALPENTESWHDILGIPDGADEETIRRAYKRRAQESHPDKGGSRGEWDRIQRAYEMCMKTA